MTRQLLAALAATALLLSACGQAGGSGADGSAESAQAGAGEQDTSAAGTRTVSTAEGEVTVPADPQRVVLLNYALAGYLYDLDVPVVAMTPEVADQAEGEFSEFWADDARAQGTEFMPWSSDGFDLEAILAAEPDLIVGGGIGFPLMQAQQAYDDLSEIAPTVLVAGEHHDWHGQFSFLAEDVFGKPETYQEAVDRYEDRIGEVREAITPPPLPAVFLTITSDETPYALVESVGQPTVFDAVGITPAPIFEENDVEVYGGGGDMFELSRETVGEMADYPTVFVQGFNGDFASVEELSDDPVYVSLEAFRNGHAYDLPYWTLRGDYDETMALLDIIEDTFA